MLNSDNPKRFIEKFPEEGRLLRLAKYGNTRAFIQLYDVSAAHVHAYIYSLVSDGRIADGLTFQVFFKAWKFLDRYKSSDSSFVVWLCSIARDQVADYFSTHQKNIRPNHAFGLMLDPGRKPSMGFSSTFNTYTRDALIQYMSLHPRQSRIVLPLVSRAALTLSMLVAALFITGTVHAQSVLPGDNFYPWKRTSEKVWRVFSPDSVSTDIAIANRRIDELVAVAGDPVRSASAMNGYLEVLARLKLTSDSESLALIVPVLEAQHVTLNEAGLASPELDTYLVVAMQVVNVQSNIEVVVTVTVANTLPPTSTYTNTPTDVPANTSTSTSTATNTSTPTQTATNTLIPTSTPTDILTATATPIPTDVPTDIPTEIVPTVAPTEIVPTVVPAPTDEPTAVPTEDSP